VIAGAVIAIMTTWRRGRQAHGGGALCSRPRTSRRSRSCRKDSGGSSCATVASRSRTSDPLAQYRARGLAFELMETSFFLSREQVVPSPSPDLLPWRERVFATLSALALNATEFFQIPPNRVVELGTQVEV
jgi:hypothetical protein